MSGIEIALIGCVAASTGIGLANVVQSSGIVSRFKRWWRMRKSRLVTVTMAHNASVFYQISKSLNAVSAKLKHRTILSWGDSKETHCCFIPDRNTEIAIPIAGGSQLHVKVVSLDGYRIDAYEVTCSNNTPQVIDHFFFNILKEIRGLCPIELANFRTAFGILSL